MKIWYVLMGLHLVIPIYAMQADKKTSNELGDSTASAALSEKPPKKYTPRKNKSRSLSLPVTPQPSSLDTRNRSQSLSSSLVHKQVAGLILTPAPDDDREQEGAMMRVIQAMSPEGPQESAQHATTSRPHTVSPVIRVLRRQRLSRAELEAAQKQIDSGSTQ